jgi:hypothetical protein
MAMDDRNAISLPSNESDRKRSRSDEERSYRQRKRSYRVGRRRDHSTERSDEDDEQTDSHHEDPVLTFPPSTSSHREGGSSRYHSILADRRQSGGATSTLALIDALTQPLPQDTHWSDVVESRPFRLTHNCGFEHVPPWHREAVLGLRHTMPPWRCCKKPEDNFEHFLYPLWQDPAFSGLPEGVPVVPPLEELLHEIMAEKAPELLEEARAERRAAKQTSLQSMSVEASVPSTTEVTE